MTPRAWFELALVAVAGLLGMAYCNGRDSWNEDRVRFEVAREEQTAALEQAQEEARSDSAAAVAAAERAALAELQRDSANAANRQLLIASREREKQATARAAEIGRTVAESFDSLRAVVPAAVLSLVDSTEAQHDAQVGELAAANAEARQQNATLAQLLSVTDRQVGLERAAKEAAQQDASSQRARANAAELLAETLGARVDRVDSPGFLKRARDALPWFVGGAVVGVVACARYCP